MRSRRPPLLPLALAPLACGAALLGGAAPARAEGGRGVQIELSAGLGSDDATSPVGGGTGPAPVAAAGIGVALLNGPLTIGVRAERAPVPSEHDNSFLVAEVGAHRRSGMFKLSAVFEAGAHQLSNVGTQFFGPQTSNSAVLPTVGVRASADIAAPIGPTLGWWIEYRHDVGLETIDTSAGAYVIGGGFFATGFQVGLDFQRWVTRPGTGS